MDFYLRMVGEFLKTGNDGGNLFNNTDGSRRML